MGALGAYVTAEDDMKFYGMAEGTVSVTVTHSNLQQQWPELRFDLHTTVGALKDRLYRHGGTGGAYQRLLLKSADGTVLCELKDDTKMLGFYGVQSGQVIHIVDTDPYSFSKDGGLENVNLVKKYEMSDEDYDKRENTLRAYKRKQREKDPHFTFFPENRRAPAGPPPGPESVAGIEVGQRCEVNPGGRRGEVKFVGEWKNVTKEINKGFWVGVKLDEPLGKSNGTIKGVKYFECADKYGCFARPAKVTCGDFPEIDEFASDSEEEL